VTNKKKREMLASWLFEMYSRACRENQIKQARFISNLLAQMSRSEYPLTR
jgi:hypothetical protein